VKRALAAALCLSSTACSFNSLGKNVAGGAAEGLQPHARELTLELVAGARDSLLSDETKRRVIDLEKAVITTAADTVADEHTEARLRDLEKKLIDELSADLLKTENNLLGDQLKLRIADIRDELLSAKTTAELLTIRDQLLGPRLGELLNQTVQEVLGQQTEDRAAALRDRLLGKQLQNLVDALIAQMMKTAGQEYKKSIQPVLQDTEVRVRDIVIWIVSGVLAVVSALLAYAHYLRGKYKSIAGMLAAKIEQVSPIVDAEAPRDPRALPTIKKQIETEAISRGLEPKLHRLLYDTGINKTPEG
jgi:hypothetical protein